MSILRSTNLDAVPETELLELFERDDFALRIRTESNTHSKVHLWHKYVRLYHLDSDDLGDLWEDLETFEEETNDLIERLKFYEILLLDHKSTAFYLQYLQFLNNYINKSSDTTLWSKFELLLHQALNDTSFDFLKGHEISNFYINYLEAKNEIGLIKEHYLKRLGTAHQSIDQTFQQYISFINRIGTYDLETETHSANKIYQNTKHDQYDLELLYIKKKEQSVEEYWSDIITAVSSVSKKKRNINKVIPVFETALDHVESIELWERFVQILYQYDSESLIESYLPRFLIAFPQSAKPYIELLRNLSSFSECSLLYSKIKTRVSYVSKTVDFEHWKDLSIAQLSFLLYQLKLGNQEFRDEFIHLSKEGFKRALEMEDNTFHSVERFVVNANEILGDIPRARELLRDITKNYPSESEGWLISYYFEKKNDPSLQNAAKILKAAVTVSQSLDWPERIFEEALRFSELHGDVKLYQLLRVKIIEKEKLVQAIREAQQQQQQYHIEDLEEKTSSISKRKLDKIHNDDTIESSKRAKSNNHQRDRENLTIAVRNIPKSISENQIRFLFKDCGTINELRLIELDDYLQANVEFTNPQDLLKALTKDYKRLGGKEIRVQKLISTIWVANYPHHFTKEDFQDLFGKFGPIVSIRLPSLLFNSQRRFCYIEFADSQSAHSAVDSLDGEQLDKLKLIVKISDPSSKQARTGAAEEGRELYVKRLDFYKVTSNKVKQLFSKYGNVENVHLPLNEDNRKQGKKHDGYGFVVFSTADEAQKALELNFVSFEGRAIEVSIAQKKAQRAHEKEVRVAKDYSKSKNVIALQNLPDTINAEQLKLFFQKFGNVLSTILEPDYKGAIVQFQDERDAANASLAANGQIFQDYVINIVSVQEMRKDPQPSTRRKVGLVPSSMRNRIAALEIDPTKRKNDTKKAEERLDQTTPTPDTNTELKSNADFRKMFLGK